MKLHDTTVHSIKDGPQLKSIEPAPAFDEETTSLMTTSDIQCESRRNLIKSQDSLEDSFSSNDLKSCINSSAPTHFIAVVSASSTSPSSFSSQNASSQMKTICYEQASNVGVTPPTPVLLENFSRDATPAAAASSISSREKYTDLQQQPPPTSSTPATPITPTRSPVKAPRTSRTAQAISKLNGSSSGNIVGGSSTSSLNRSNSCISSTSASGRHNNFQSGSNNQSPSVAGVISLIENEPCSSSSKCDDEGNQSQINGSNNQTSLELSTSSSLSSSLTATGPISNNSEMSNNPAGISRSSNNSNASNNNSRSTSRTSLSTGSSGIPRMASPARSKIPCGQQQQHPPSSPAVKPRRAANTSRNQDRSSSPHGSKLPVRKTSFMPTSTSSASRHPAATSKSLPANTNMGTAFQIMSKSGGAGQGNKHSKSTFGFGSKISPNNNGNSNNSTRNAGGGGTKNGNTPCSTTTTNLPDCSGSGSASNSVSTTKPIKLVASSAVVGPTTQAIGNITRASGNGKDEGYSTMSSEALAEQEHHHHHPLRHNNSLEKSSQQQQQRFMTVNAGGNKLPLLPVATVPPTTFSSGKGGNAKNGTLPLPSSSYSTGNKSRVSSGSSTASTTATTALSVADAGANRNSIHKSNTFNTFREVVGESSGRKEQSSRIYNSTCDADDDDDDEEETSFQMGKNNYRNPAGRGRVMAAVSSFSQHTSLPTSSSSASSSPSKGKAGGSSSSSSASHTTTKRSAKSKDHITATTRMMDGNIVRIVRGSPYSIQFGDESGDDMEDEEDASSSTILWEDSDDSDVIYFLSGISGIKIADFENEKVTKHKC